MTATRSSFSLSGPSVDLDPRVFAVRGDLADVSLADRLFAPHYAQAVLRACVLPFAPLFDKPNGAQSSELLTGEHFMMLDASGDWAWGWCAHDHYVGYIARDALGEANGSPPVTPEADPVEVARGFLGQPYVWGGRGGAGIDCSGLVQRALAAQGIAAPRDSDMQLAALGETLADDAALQKGDLVFFTGHVGLAADDTNLIHATRHHGKTVIEPLADVIARIAAEHPVPVVARKRIG